MSESLSKSLSAERKLQKITQESLSNKLGKHRTYVSKIENGNRNLTLDELKKYCAALNLDVKIFL